MSSRDDIDSCAAELRAAMPAWGDMLTVNDIWDTVNFIRTIPNGGLVKEDLDPSMMVSPPDVRPIDATGETMQRCAVDGLREVVPGG